MKAIKKLTSIIILLIMFIILNSPIISYADGNEQIEEQTENVETNYQIKEIEEWDISKNGDESVKAKWTLEDKKISISGNGEMNNTTLRSKYRKIVEKIEIESEVTNIGDKFFKGCNSLESISVEDNNQNYTSVEGVLYNKSKTKLIYYPAGRKNTRFTILNSVETLEHDSFSINIEDSVFKGCSSLESISVEENNQNYTSIEGVLYNKSKTKLICYPAGRTNTNFTMPNSVQTIEQNAFYGCNNLKSIMIQNGIEKINNAAFKGCNSLENITIPNSVNEIGESAFELCNNLKSIIIPNGVTSIKQSTFENCSSLKNIVIPGNMENIKYDAFYNCHSLESISLPSSITSIGRDAFSGFKGPIFCYTNSEAHKYAEKEEIGYILLDDVTSDITTSYLIKEEEIIDISEKKDRSVTAKWTLEDRTITISGNGNMKVWNCDEIDEDDGYEEWNKEYFKYANIANHAIITQGVKNIGDNAFYESNCLIDITIPKETTSIGDNVFDGCINLKSINVEENNQNYTSIDGVLFNKNKTEIICYPSEKEDKDYIIPNSVRDIADSAFNECCNLESVTIPESITNISDFAFYYCKNLKSIIIPASVTTIGYCAFRECNSLKNIIIPSSVTKIEDYTFFGCKGPIICKRNSEAHSYAENYEIGYFLMKDADINEDNMIDMVDVLIILQHLAQEKSIKIAQKHPNWKLSNKVMKYADTDKNEKVETNDVMMLLKYIAAKKKNEIAERHPEWLNLD